MTLYQKIRLWTKLLGNIPQNSNNFQQIIIKTEAKVEKYTSNIYPNLLGYFFFKVPIYQPKRLFLQAKSSNSEARKLGK